MKISEVTTSLGKNLKIMQSRTLQGHSIKKGVDIISRVHLNLMMISRLFKNGFRENLDDEWSFGPRDWSLNVTRDQWSDHQSSKSYVSKMVSQPKNFGTKLGLSLKFFYAYHNILKSPLKVSRMWALEIGSIWLLLKSHIWCWWNLRILLRKMIFSCWNLDFYEGLGFIFKKLLISC